MDVTPNKRKRDLIGFPDNQHETPKKRENVVMSSRKFSSDSESSTELTPTKIIQKPSMKENEISSYYFLTPQSSPQTSTPFTEGSKSFYKTSTTRQQKDSKADLIKRYSLSSSFVSANKSVTTVCPKLKATSVPPRIINKVQRKQQTTRVEKKERKRTEHLEIAIKLAAETNVKTPTTSTPITNRKFFKSEGLGDRRTIQFGKHIVPLASMTKVISKNVLKPSKDFKQVQNDTSPADVEKPVFALNDEEPTCSYPSSPLSNLGKSENERKQQWPIKYTPDIPLPKRKKTNSPLNPITKKRKNLNGNEKEQMMIDAGQVDIGPKQCNDCGMLYAPNDENDVAIHLKMHNLVNTTLTFLGWKNERVVKEYDNGRVILILPDDPYYAQKKVDDVKIIVDQNLGFSQKAQPNRDELKVYLYVSSKKIVGSLFAEPIKSAFRIVVNDDENVGTPLCCGTEPEPASCGVNRIWTLASHRRLGIASRLLDCMLQSFYYGCMLSCDKIAFTDPTPDGRRFASNYFKTPKFLVYKC